VQGLGYASRVSGSNERGGGGQWAEVVVAIVAVGRSIGDLQAEVGTA
jgi:hypothetical protein